VRQTVLFLLPEPPGLAARQPQRPSANKRAKFQVGHENLQELANFLCLSRLDACLSFGTDFWRFIGVLPTPDRQCKLFTFRTRLTMPTFDGQCCLASITVSATPDENLSPQMPFSSGAEVLWPRTVATGVADTMIEAQIVNRLSSHHL
jgi:hypothetical protein